MLVADTNEFHPLVNGKAYTAARAPDGSPFSIIILRASYSTFHVDNAYASSLVQARVGGALVGHYGYMTKNDDPTAAGTFFGQVVRDHGGLRPGDTIWCDDEETATGNEAPRIQAFLTAAHNVLHDNPVDEGEYTGDSFFRSYVHAKVQANGVVTHLWIASYGVAAPSDGEDLFQFTDNQSVPGVAGNCDCSTFNGTLAQFLAIFSGGPAPVPGPTTPALARPCVAIVVRPQGDGYWEVAQDGGLFPFGACVGIIKDNPVPGANLQPGHLIEDASVWPDGNGLIMLGEDGGTFPLGSAKSFGNITGITHPSPNPIQ